MIIARRVRLFEQTFRENAKQSIRIYELLSLYRDLACRISKYPMRNSLTPGQHDRENQTKENRGQDRLCAPEPRVDAPRLY